MKLNKHSTKKYSTKEILDLLGIANSESQINDNNCEKLNQIDNNETLDKEKNKNEYIVEPAELGNIEKEISLFEKEENQYNIENINISDAKKNLNPIEYLLNPDLDNDTEDIISKINSSSEEIDIDEENEYLGYDKDKNYKFNDESKNINEYDNKMFDERGSLNNLNNPFIKAIKEVGSKK